MAGEILNAMPTVQAYTHEAIEADRFGASVERAFATAMRRVRARSLLTVRRDRAGVRRHRLRAVAGRARGDRRHDDGRRAGPVHPLRRHRRRRRRRAGRDDGRGAARGRRHRAAAGAAGGALAHPVAGAPAAAAAARERRGGARAGGRELPLPLAAAGAVARAPVARGAARRDGGGGRALGRGQDDALPAAAAVLRPAGRAHHARRRRDPRASTCTRCATRSGSSRRTP